MRSDRGRSRRLPPGSPRLRDGFARPARGSSVRPPAARSRASAACARCDPRAVRAARRVLHVAARAPLRQRSRTPLRPCCYGPSALRYARKPTNPRVSSSVFLRFLAWAAFSPASKIRARAWSFDEGQRIDAAFLASRVPRAVRRAGLVRSPERRRAAGPRRGRRPAGLDRRPLWRHAGGAVPVGRRASAGRPLLVDALLAATGLDQALRALGYQRPRARKACPPRPAGCAASGPTELTIREHDWQLTPGHRDRPQDRLLPGPARQPPAIRANWPRGCSSAACSIAFATPAASPCAALAGLRRRARSRAPN